MAFEQKFDALEAKMDRVPPKRRDRAAWSSLSIDTFVWEREWDSLATLEAYQQQVVSDPEWASVLAEVPAVMADHHFELYWPL
jgi:hypothetical protein